MAIYSVLSGHIVSTGARCVDALPVPESLCFSILVFSLPVSLSVSVLCLSLSLSLSLSFFRSQNTPPERSPHQRHPFRQQKSKSRRLGPAKRRRNNSARRTRRSRARFSSEISWMKTRTQWDWESHTSRSDASSTSTPASITGATMERLHARRRTATALFFHRCKASQSQVNV